ncbi:MAG: hypothetical protein K2V38_14115, partial [Gemmataceae bacterium]|nr:hypothetical protein [Gemmataceae bacterium]
MRKNAPNVGLFLVLAVGLYFLVQYAGEKWMPKPEDRAAKLAEALKKQAEEEDKRLAELREKRQAEEAALAAAGGGLAVARDLPKPKPPELPKDAQPAPALAGVDVR